LVGCKEEGLTFITQSAMTHLKRNASAEKSIPELRKLEEEEKPPEYMPMITVMLATFGMMLKVTLY
jgi:hypothetical protein